MRKSRIRIKGNDRFLMMLCKDIRRRWMQYGENRKEAQKDKVCQTCKSKEAIEWLEWVYDVYHKGRFERRKLYGGKILENISQALAGVLCKTAMARMGNACVGQVHDELHVLCKRGLGLVMSQKLKLDAEVGVGASWGEAK